MTAAERALTLDGLKPYPAYKDSGAGWIGDIPSTWQASRLRNSMLLNPRKSERALPEEVSFVPMEAVGEDGSMDVTTTRPVEEVLSGYTYFTDGDLLIAKVTPCFENGKGAVARNLTNGVGFGSTEFHVLRGTERMTAEFAYYLTLSHGFRKLGEGSMYGAGGQKRVGTAFMRDVVVPTPPDAEQLTIAAFLDHETARIDALVREQELLLEDLAEKRRATVNHATLAATPVDSPQLPVGWRNATLKTLLTSFEQGWSPQCDNRPAVEGEWGVLKVGCVNGHTFNAEENKVLPDDLEPLTRYSLKQDDVLISRANTRDLVGSAARVERDYPNLLLCDKLYRLRTDEAQLRPAYLVLLLNSPIARAAIETSASGASASMVNISQSTIRNLVFPIPPANEQDNIIIHLDERLAQIDALVLEVRANIEDMKLLRSTLITAATTGKIDVRDWRPA